MIWFLGPPNPTEEPVYKFCKPQDWLRRRQGIGWNTDKAMEVRRKEIQGQLNAIDCLKASTDGFLDLISTYDHLVREANEVFGSTLYAEGMTMDQVMTRADRYLKLLNRLATMRGKAQELSLP